MIAPLTEVMDNEVYYLYGEFDLFIFEMRAFKVEKDCLSSISLFSSEAELLMSLIEENIEFSALSESEIYRL